jgi:hypothetical protein
MGIKTAQLNRMVATIFVGSLLLTGCGGGMGGCNDGNKDKENSGLIVDDSKMEASTNDEGPQYQHPTTDNLQGVEQKFPARYPVPRYPNSRVVMASVRPNLVPGQHNIVLLKSSDQGIRISSYYRTELPKQGWKLSFQLENLSFTQLRYRKGDQEIEVRVMPDPQGRQHVQLVSGPYQPIQTFDEDLTGTNPPPAR